MNQDEADQDVADEMSGEDVRCVCVFIAVCFLRSCSTNSPTTLNPYHNPLPATQPLRQNPLSLVKSVLSERIRCVLAVA